MRDFFSEFNPVSKEQWIAKIQSELSGQDLSLLEQFDPIEELHFSSYYHVSDQKTHENPGGFPYTRGLKTKSNHAINTAFVLLEDEIEGNAKILHVLMTGADGIWITTNRSNLNWSAVLKDIQFDYISAQFSVSSIEDCLAIKEITGEIPSVQFNFDFVESNPLAELKTISDSLKVHQQRFALVNGFGIQQVGGTSWQEIAFCLNAGHEYLLALMSNGFSIDEASACIGFHIGIGSNYLNEIAKIRAMRSLWSKIIHAYSPAHACSHTCAMTAIVGCMNKSLLDPHTNLLRQTTEVLSAMCGGVDQLVVLPHDLYSDRGMSSISQRMAINIPLVLREESYLDKVIDPLGGSYSLEQLTTKIGKKAWETFQSLEKSGGLFEVSTRGNFRNEIITKRAQRERAFLDGTISLIGINTYSNPEKIEANWQELPSYFGIDALNYERISKTVSA